MTRGSIMAVDPDKIFNDLSSDPWTASYQLLQRLNKQILNKSPPTDDDYAIANGFLEAFYESHGWPPPNRATYTSSQSDSVDELARKIRAAQRLQYEAYVSEITNNYKAATKRTAKQALDAALGKAVGYAILEPSEKEEINKHIENVRKIIEESGLDDRKKNDLFERLSDLTKEVSRNGTRTDRFFAFASELGFCLGQFTKNAKPAITETKAIMRIIWGARARHDGIKLPPGDGDMPPLLPEPDQTSAS
jgi:hypothetical protein